MPARPTESVDTSDSTLYRGAEATPSRREADAAEDEADDVDDPWIRPG